MIRIFVNIIFKIYNLTFSYLDKISNEKKLNTYEYYKKGFKVLNIKQEIEFSHNILRTIRVNKYLEKIIFSEKEIIKILNSIFIENKLKEIITNITGFNYSIDFFTAYKTERIKDEDIKYGWYANHWHKDKPFSKFFIKLIVPMEKIDNDMGGIEIISADNPNTKNLENLKADFKMISRKNEILVFSPNLCHHQAGKLTSEKARKQIMLQLNPSKEWVYNGSLFYFQEKREPKFPFFSYFFSKKIKI